MPTTLITGSNRGIGLQLATQLHQRGDNIIAVCRTASEELSDLGVRIIEGIDVRDGDSVAMLAKQLSGESIDTLINNAGILRRDGFGDLDYDAMMEQYRVNTLGLCA